MKTVKIRYFKDGDKWAAFCPDFPEYAKRHEDCDLLAKYVELELLINITCDHEKDQE